MKLLVRLRKFLFIVFAADPLWFRALRLGVAPAVEHAPTLRHLDCQTVVDIGANRGQFALAAHRYLPEARIISFEPLPIPSSTFRRIFSGENRVRLFTTAVGPQHGSVTAHISQRDDSSSLLPITELQSRLFPGTAEVKTITVNSTHLSACIATDDILSPALLKVDVQGFELQALQACDDIIDRFAHVYVECSFMELYTGQALAHEVIAWLRERRLGLRGIYNVVYDANGQSIQADLLFSRLSDLN